MASAYAGPVQIELRSIPGYALVGAAVKVYDADTDDLATLYNDRVLIADAEAGDLLVNHPVTGVAAAAGPGEPGLDAEANLAFFGDSDAFYDIEVIWQGAPLPRYRVKPEPDGRIGPAEVAEAMLAFGVATQDELDAVAGDVASVATEVDAAVAATSALAAATDAALATKASTAALTAGLAGKQDTIPPGTYAEANVFSRAAAPGAAPTHGDVIVLGDVNAVASDLGTATILGGGDTNYENVIGAASTANVNTASSNLPTATGTGANWSTITGGYDNIANGMASSIQGFHNVTESASTHGTISGGSIHKILDGDYNTIGGGTQNQTSGDASTIGGGAFNVIAAAGNRATIAGGGQNSASGYGSTISGGEQHTATGTGSAVGGGVSNDSTNHYATISGGLNNTCSSQYGVVGGGSGNTAGAGTQATVGGGLSNQATGASSTVAGGQVNTATATAATVVGGRENNATGLASTAMGREARADVEGQVMQASGKFAVNGDAQTGVCVQRVQTTNATQTEMWLNGASGRKTILVDSTWVFTVWIVARRTDANGESAAYKFEGCMDRDSTGATALVGAVTKTVIAEDTAAWDADVDVDATNFAIRARVTGEAAKTINWVARIQTVEVIG